ncbi:hypothetical protein HK098_002724 [Nowakowskiella sp. JEL0407]|nr:hypothetical protein HK098_002724 [Nowakowskiella sp. JEL0407]
MSSITFFTVIFLICTPVLAAVLPPVNIYVSKTPNTQNDGLSLATAFLTVDDAIIYVQRYVNATNYPSSVTINIGPGTFQMIDPGNIADIPSNVTIIGQGSANTIILSSQKQLSNGHFMFSQINKNFNRPTHTVENLSLKGGNFTSSSPITALGGIDINVVDVFFENMFAGGAIELYKDSVAYLNNLTIYNGSPRSYTANSFLHSPFNAACGIYVGDTSNFQGSKIKFLVDADWSYGPFIALESRSNQPSILDYSTFAGWHGYQQSLANLYSLPIQTLAKDSPVNLMAGTLIIKNCAFQDFLNGPSGAFLYSDRIAVGPFVPTMTVYNSTFKRISTFAFGGIASVFGSGSFTCSNCTFERISAISGGLIHCGGKSSVKIFDSKFTDLATTRNDVPPTTMGNGGIMFYEDTSTVLVDGLYVEGIISNGGFFTTYSFAGVADFKRIDLRNTIVPGWGGVFLQSANVDSAVVSVYDSNFYNISSGMGSFVTIQAGTINIYRCTAKLMLPGWGGAGCIYTGDTAKLNFYDSVLEDVVGQWGGSVSLPDGKMYFQNTTFRHMANSGWAGGFEIYKAEVTLKDCFFEEIGFSRPAFHGVVPSPHPWDIYKNDFVGATIRVYDGVLTMENVVFKGCSTFDGGIYISGTTAANLKNITVSGGNSTQGPGIRISSNFKGTLSLYGGLFEGNSATEGGAIALNDQGLGTSTTTLSNAKITLKNLVFRNNVAKRGGALWSDWRTSQDQFECSGCSFVKNTAEVGGAIYATTSDRKPFNIWKTCSFSSNSAMFYGDFVATQPMTFSISNPVLDIPTSASLANSDKLIQNFTLSNVFPSAVTSGTQLSAVTVVILDGFGQIFDHANLTDSGRVMKVGELIMNNWYLVSNSSNSETSTTVSGDAVQVCVHGRCNHQHLTIYGVENQNYVLRMQAINSGGFRELGKFQLNVPITISKCPVEDGLHYLIYPSGNSSSSRPPSCEIPQCPQTCKHGKCTPDLTWY